MTWGAKFTVEVEDGYLHLRSESAVVLEWMDVGQHGENIKKFLKRLDDFLEDEEDDEDD